MRLIVGMSGTVILKMRVTTMMLARQMSAMVTVSPWQYVPVAASWVSRLSTACRPVVNQWVCQARHAASSKPDCAVRYFLMRGVMSGCVSAASMPAIERTRARACAPSGRSAGFG